MASEIVAKLFCASCRPFDVLNSSSATIYMKLLFMGAFLLYLGCCASTLCIVYGTSEFI